MAIATRSDAQPKDAEGIVTTDRLAPGFGRSGAAKSAATTLCWIQGIYFFVLGIWPLLSIETFQAVTGKKTDHLVTGRESDHWLVNTVGALVAANGIVFLAAAWRKSVSFEIALLGITTAVALTAIDVIYVLRNVIAPIYLLDAAIEVLFAAGWAAWLYLRQPNDDRLALGDDHP
jgi:hypothetical protein